MELTEQTKLEILSAYLPHGAECNVDGKIATMNSVYSDGTCTFYDLVESDKGFESIRPILRHPDDMTESELSQLGKFLWNDQGLNNNIARENATNWLKGYLKVSISPQWAINSLRYLHSIHVDTFGAIEAGWAVRKNIDEKAE